MAQGHDFFHAGDVLIAGGVQDESLAVAGDFVAAVMFFLDLAQFTKKRVDVAPFEVVRDGVLENSVEGALMRGGEWRGGFHGVGKIGA